MRKLVIFTLSFIFIANILKTTEAQQEWQKIDDLERKVEALEKYIEKLRPTLDGLTKNLLENIDERMEALADKVIVLNPVSKKFSKIETNAGEFLLAVHKMEKIENGYRLVLHIGNPNQAVYGGVKLKLRWGKKWEASFIKPTYEEWRRSLTIGQYSYLGSLESGRWTEVTVDLVPAQFQQIEYIECEMEVNTIQLQKVNTL